ncbi:MAG: alpha-ketoglutarate-dependent dioxygenase AlkB [Pseudomonadota bacterium]|nr:alpha-ketoglutarate-dependent dioxygenase AlkB [Pseudomonadota bacterium]
MNWQRIELPGADVALQPHWLAPVEADGLLAALLATIPWETHRIRLFGRDVASPRLSCWIGDAGAGYTYSRTRFEPRPWPPALAALRARVEAACRTRCGQARFNSVLANLYRDGSDSMGWHSDDEPELGAQPLIASLSLGAERCLRFRRRLPRGVRTAAGDTFRLPLPHGSLLCMAGRTQQLYRHDLPKTRAPTAARLNLTFRWVTPQG